MNVLIGDKRMFMEIKSNFQRQYIFIQDDLDS